MICDCFGFVFTVAHLVSRERGGLVIEMDTVEDRDQVESLVTRVERLLITSLPSGYYLYSFSFVVNWVVNTYSLVEFIL